MKPLLQSTSIYLMPKHQHHQMWIVNCSPNALLRSEDRTVSPVTLCEASSAHLWMSELLKWKSLFQTKWLSWILCLRWSFMYPHSTGVIKLVILPRTVPFHWKEALGGGKVWSRISLDICVISEKKHLTIAYNICFPEGVRALDGHLGQNHFHALRQSLESVILGYCPIQCHPNDSLPIPTTSNISVYLLKPLN